MSLARRGNRRGNQFRGVEPFGKEFGQPIRRRKEGEGGCRKTSRLVGVVQKRDERRRWSGPHGALRGGSLGGGEGGLGSVLCQGHVRKKKPTTNPGGKAYGLPYVDFALHQQGQIPKGTMLQSLRGDNKNLWGGGGRRNETPSKFGPTLRKKVPISSKSSRLRVVRLKGYPGCKKKRAY